MAELPSGTVTFLFSDVEGSTQLLESHPHEMGAALQRHHEIFEQIVDAHGGAIFETIGDAVYAAFARASDAVAAALDIQRELANQDWGVVERVAVRLAIHTGEVERRGDHYFGPALFRCARLEAIGYGEQTLLTEITANLARPGLPDRASLRDLGHHRLKDLGEPEHVFMLVHPDLRDRFPPPRSLDLYPNNLPVQLSTFIGRGKELAEVQQLLASHRLVTIVGPGGMGKTRFALQAAAERLESYPDGVFFVDLSALADAHLVLPAIATGIGLREGPESSLAKSLAAFLADRQTLVILDNVEQVVQCASDVATLLRDAPSLRMLATSRIPLHIRGEHRYELAPLLGPSSSDATSHGSDAARLFADRAAEVDPEFTLTPDNRPLVELICTVLDRMPLAIELAAARIRLLPLQALEDELRRHLDLPGRAPLDAPVRQQTLQATIQWSVELLAEGTKSLFEALGIFAGGFTPNAVSAVASLDRSMALRVLADLQENSLVRAVPSSSAEPRFGLYEPIRQFLTERAGDVPGDLARRHAAFYADLAESLEPSLLTGQGRAREQTAEEIDNSRAALAYAFSSGDDVVAARLGNALWWFWATTGWFAEGRENLERIAAMEGISEALRADALSGLGAMLEEHGLSVEARGYLEQAETLFRQTGEQRGIAKTCNFLGRALSSMGLIDESDQVYRRGLEAAIASSQRAYEGWIRGNLGVNRVRIGDFEAAEAIMQAALLASDPADLGFAIVGWNNLGELAATREAWALAEQYSRLVSRMRPTLEILGYSPCASQLSPPSVHCRTSVPACRDYLRPRSMRLLEARGRWRSSRHRTSRW